jgi:hypothetical protein
LQISFAQRQKAHEEPQQQQQQCTLVTSVTGVLSTFCGETSLCPQCCCVQQLGVSGCKKPIWFIVELLQTRWTLVRVGCECRHQCTKPRERHDNNHYPVDCCFSLLFICMAILIAIDWCALSNVTLMDLINPWMQPCESPRFNRCASFALAVEDFNCSLRSSSRSDMQ